MFKRATIALGVLCILLCGLAVPVTAEDAALTLEQPSTQGQRLSSSSLWRTLDPHLHELSPTWQRRCLELRSIAEDTDTIGAQLPPLVLEFKRKFLQAQSNVVFLLLDLAPTTMEASENHKLIVRLEEWEWYLADIVGPVATVEQELITYAAVLREVGDALELPRTADTSPNAALLEVIPELRSLHALIEARVAHLESTIAPWLRPARTMLTQMQAALQSTRRVQPQLWLNYYFSPKRISQLSFERAWSDLRNMGATLAQVDGFARSGIRTTAMVGVVTLFVLGAFVLLCRALAKVCTAPLSSETPLWQVLGRELHKQSMQRKVALAVGGVCTASIFLDALSVVHMHIPYVRVHMCLLLASVAVWSRNSKTDPPLWALWAPVVGGFVLLESNAPPLWILMGMSVLLLGSAVVMALRRTRSVFHNVWLIGMALGLLLTFIGFGRVAALLLGCLLFLRVAFVVLLLLYRIKGLRNQPLWLSLLMPGAVVWVYSLGLVLGTGYPGVDAMWDNVQADALQFFGVQLQLRELLLLLALAFSLLVFSGVSRQALHKVSRQRALLDSSAVPVIHAVVNSLLWLLFGLFALGLLGMDMRSLAFIGGALTVGIGLGLQGIISNFFSGLVIIFGKVVRGGDIVEVGSVHGRVHSVNMRATVVETEEGAILLVPNVEMLNSHLTNWTRNNRHVREDIKVRLVQQGDVESIMILMEKVATNHENILPIPEPKALLLKSDEGVVDIALQVWVADVDSKRVILSSLQTELYRAFAEEGINLAGLHMNVVVKAA